MGRAGEGVVLFCTLTSCYLVRFKQNGDLMMMFVIPRPFDSESSTVPTAAWVPPGRLSQAATLKQGNVVMPCGVLAVAWKERLQILQVQLIQFVARICTASSERHWSRLSFAFPAEITVSQALSMPSLATSP